MTKLRVLLDCDGVLADFHTPCLEIINQIGGTEHTLDQLDQWDIFDALKISSDVQKWVYQAMGDRGWAQKLKPYPGAVRAVEQIQTFADLYIVTSPMRGETWTFDRDEWLYSHFRIQRKQVIHCSAKELIAGDYLIDDRVENLVKWRACHPGGVALRWSPPQLRELAYDGQSFHEWSALVELLSDNRRPEPSRRTWRSHP